MDFQLYARKLKAGLRACIAETRLVRSHSYRAHIMLTSRQRADKKIPRASLNDPRVEFRPSRRTTRELIAEHAIFSVHVLTIDRLQTPEAARRRAVVHRGPGRVALRRAHTLLSVDMQAA